MECMDEVGELSGWETTSGLVLCGACFVAVHGVRAARLAGKLPKPSTGSSASRFFWITGQDGQVVQSNAFTLAAKRPPA